LKGFSGSDHLYSRVCEIIENNHIDTVIETGTYLGHTTRVFSKLVNQVITIEKDKEKVRKAKDYLGKRNNVRILVGDSRIKLSESIEQAEGNLLFYLDAHSCRKNDNPIEDELITISKYKIRPVIIIHDFKVPGRDDLGYNRYADGFSLEWKSIKEKIEDIYGDNYMKSYNESAPDNERGVIFLKPEEGNNES